MNVTAYIHTSVAFPNCAGNPSLILEKDNDTPFLIHIINACLGASAIKRVILITSDDPQDQLIEDVVHTYYSADNKQIIIHRIGREATYAYTRTPRAMRFSSFPYLARPSWGLFHLDGFKELTATYKASHALLIAADQCITITADFITEICNAIQNQTIRYIYRNPYREIIALQVAFLTELERKVKHKLTEKIINKGKSPLLVDIFSYMREDENKKYTAKNISVYKQNAVPLLRRQECRIIECLRNNVWEHYEECFMQIENYLFPFVPSYLAIEFMPEESQCSREKIEGMIADFAKTGTVLNFCGRSDPLADEALPEYIQFAKEHSISSVWLETDGTRLSADKIDALIQSGLNLLILNANAYLNAKDTLEQLITLIKQRKEALKLDTPFIAIQYVISSWLQKEANDFLQSFANTVDHMIIRSPRSYEHTGIRSQLIDFAPLKRRTCQQLLDSVGLYARGAVRICEEDVTGAITLDPHDTRTVPDLLNTPLHMNIIEEQSRGVFGEAFMPCAKCNVWYIPNIKDSFYGIDFSAFRMSGDVLTLELTALQLSDCETHERKLRTIIKRCNTALQQCHELMAYFAVTQNKKAADPVEEYEQRYTDRLQQHTVTIEFLRNTFLSYIIPLGEAYIVHNEFGKALALWELVLQYDPTNSYIHKRLNELLETAKT